MLEDYIEYSKNKNLYNKLYSVGKENCGTLFEYVNTNFRTTKSFYSQFNTFCEIIGLERQNWPDNGNGQEKHKQHTVHSTATKLFECRAGIYNLTEKGKVYKKLVSSFDGSSDEKWLLNLYMLQDSYFENYSNYIFERAKKILDIYKEFYSAKEIDQMIVEFLHESSRKFDNFALYDIFILHSLYGDEDLLRRYVNSTEEEKNTFKNYIVQQNISEQYGCPISNKYRKGGNFNYNMLIDEIKVFYFILKFNTTSSTFEEYNNNMLEKYSDFYSINSNKVIEFIETHKSIFKLIHSNIFEDIHELEDYSMEEQTELDNINDIKDVQEDAIDPTTYESKKYYDKVFAERKKIARKVSNYECELESLRNCQNHYFTSKSTGENYVEVHHLIPKEFRNEFEYSIEVLANYVSLCPACHRLIHSGADNEKKQLINFLHNARKERLKKVGLDVEIELLYKFNKISDK